MKTARLQSITIAWIAAAIFFALLLPKINSGNLWHNDELLAGNRAREMLLRRDPFCVTLDFQPDFQKPPLQYWLVALALHLLPEHPELAVRLPSALYGAGCLVAIAWLARKCFPSEPSLGAWSVAVLAGCGYFIHFSRIGLLDTGAAFHLTLAVGGCLLARQNPRWWWFVALQAVLGALQKMPFALGAWMLILATRLAFAKRNWNSARIFSPHLIGALAVSLIAIAAWPIIQWLRYGGGVFSLAAHREMNRLATVHESSRNAFEPYSYWWWLVRDWALPGLCAPLAVLGAFRPLQKFDEATVELATVCGIYGVVLAVLPYHSEHYLVAITPLLALLGARFLLAVIARMPAGPRWHPYLLAAAVLSAAPVACFHYFSRSRSEPDLLAAAHELRNGLTRDEDVIIDNDPTDNSLPIGVSFQARFISFYADLHRAPILRSRAEVRQLLASAPVSTNDRSACGICPKGDLSPASSAESYATRVSVHGNWVYWQHDVAERK